VIREVAKSLKNMARPEGFEPPTLCFEGRCSIQLSYGRAANVFYRFQRVSGGTFVRGYPLLAVELRDGL
jgi:hypothetical protein